MFLREKYKHESLILFIKEDKPNRYDKVNRLTKELDTEKKAKKEHPEIAEQFMKTTTSRVL
ncbi:hypothetical protein [Romboutsia sp.]|uniref:hypothetical protein n=1 Tax=Romboutsia sp. TaxID=1965302 RepID=UPI002D1B62B6|nr:hypothetical protein [Romboutsia sp.]HSQ90304.1 hypothetical protein [Romboutsia sp.]